MTSFIPQRAADLIFEYRQAIDLSVSWAVGKRGYPSTYEGFVQ